MPQRRDPPTINESSSLLQHDPLSNGLNNTCNGHRHDEEQQHPSDKREIQHPGHSIGYLGSLAIAVNSLAGPAILQLPFQYQQSGIIPTTLCLLAVALLSYYCSLYMANVISYNGNADFSKCVEFSDPFRTFWSARAYQVTQLLFLGTCLVLNTAAMVDTAHVVDSVLGIHLGGTYAIDHHGQIQHWSHPTPCTRSQVKLGQCEPYNNHPHGVILTLGYVVTAAVFMPICFMELKENALWQIGGLVLLVSLCVYFCGVFSLAAVHQHHDALYHVSLWGHSYDEMLGVVLFNFALVLAIPAWLHEKQSHVNVHTVVGGSTALATVLYIGVGVTAAMAIPHCNVNMIEPMIGGAFGEKMAFAGSLFSFFIIGLDIPLFSVLTRYNLTHSGMCTPRMANIVVVWLPWSLSWILYQGDAVGQLLDWGGTLLTSAIAFLLPLCLALRILTTTEQVGSVAVYGANCFKSRQAQVRALYMLLVVTSAAVFAAIFGQLLSIESKYELTHSTEYVNGQNWTWPGFAMLTMPRKAGLIHQDVFHSD
jgi:amino acid permease